MDKAPGATKIEGDLEEVEKECEKVTEQLDEDKTEAEEWKQWHPKEGDNDKDLEEKTVEAASSDTWLGQLEKKIYRLIVQFNDLYFDNRLVSAVLMYEEEYTLIVKINDIPP